MPTRSNWTVAVQVVQDTNVSNPALRVDGNRLLVQRYPKDKLCSFQRYSFDAVFNCRAQVSHIFKRLIEPITHDLIQHNTPGTIFFQAHGPHIIIPASVTQKPQQLPSTFSDLIQLTIRYLIENQQKGKQIHAQLVQVFEDTTVDLLREKAEEDLNYSDVESDNSNGSIVSEFREQQRPSTADSAKTRVGTALGRARWTSVAVENEHDLAAVLAIASESRGIHDSISDSELPQSTSEHQRGRMHSRPTRLRSKSPVPPPPQNIVATVVTLLLNTDDRFSIHQPIPASIRFVLLANTEQQQQNSKNKNTHARRERINRSVSPTTQNNKNKNTTRKRSSKVRLRTSHDDAHAFAINTSAAKAFDALIRCVKTDGVGHRDSALTNLLQHAFSESYETRCVMLAQVNGGGGNSGPFPSPSLGPVNLALRIRAAVCQTGTPKRLAWPSQACRAPTAMSLSVPDQHAYAFGTTLRNDCMNVNSNRNSNDIGGGDMKKKNNNSNNNNSRKNNRSLQARYKKALAASPVADHIFSFRDSNLQGEQINHERRKTKQYSNNLLERMHESGGNQEETNSDNDNDGQSEGGEINVRLTLKPRVNPLLCRHLDALNEKENGSMYVSHKGAISTPAISMNAGKRLDVLLDQSRRGLRDQIKQSIEHDLERVFTRRQKRQSEGGLNEIRNQCTETSESDSNGHIDAQYRGYMFREGEQEDGEEEEETKAKSVPEGLTAYTAAMIVPTLHAEVNELSSTLATTRFELSHALRRADTLENEVNDLQGARQREAEANAAQLTEGERRDGEWQRAMQAKDDDIQALKEQIDVGNERLVEEQDKCVALQKDMQARSEYQRERMQALQDEISTLQGSVVTLKGSVDTQRQSRQSEHQRVTELENKLRDDSERQSRIKRQLEIAKRAIAEVCVQVASDILAEIGMGSLPIPPSSDSTAALSYEPLEDCVVMLMKVIIGREKNTRQLVINHEKNEEEISRKLAMSRESLNRERNNSQRVMNGLEKAKQALAEANEQCRKNLSSVGGLRADKADTEAHLREALRRHEVTLGELSFVRNDLDDAVREASRLRHLWKSAQSRAAKAEEANDMRRNFLVPKTMSGSGGEVDGDGYINGNSNGHIMFREGGKNKRFAVGENEDNSMNGISSAKDAWKSGNNSNLQELPPSLSSVGFVADGLGSVGVAAAADIFPTTGEQTNLPNARGANDFSGFDTTQINAIIEATTKRTIQGLQMQKQQEQEKVVSSLRPTRLRVQPPPPRHHAVVPNVSDAGGSSPRRASSISPRSVTSIGSGVSRDRPRWV